MTSSPAGLAATTFRTPDEAVQIANATRALRGAAQAADSDSVAALAGDWSCRMTKIGGLQASVSYPPFRCAITRDGTALAAAGALAAKSAALPPVAARIAKRAIVQAASALGARPVTWA